MISLGIDIGGTGCKCVAFSDAGVQLASCYEEYAVAAGAIDLPPQVLTDAVFGVIRGCARKLEDPSDVAVMTVSSFGESFVSLDENGCPMGDIRMYFSNSESLAFDALVKRVGEERMMDICRIQPNASYSLSKMLPALQMEKPVWKFLFIAGYICYLLTGEAKSDVSLACRALLYDVKQGCWSEELLQASGVKESQLPQVVPTGTVLGTILPGVADELGLPPTVTVVIGPQDQIVNALGAGVRQPGDAVDTSGTCECITPLFPEIPETLDFQRDNYACIPYLEGRGYITYAYNFSAGSVVRWFRDALGYHLKDADKSVYTILNELAPAEPTSLMVLPFLQGMGGTPDVNPGATGLVAGLTTQTRLPDLYRAVLEGITFEMRYNMDRLAEGNVHIRRMLACGGGARSPVWLQIKADILGCEIIPVKLEETGAMGSAILGLSAILSESPLALAQRFCRYAEPVRPIPEHAEIYTKRYELYKRLRAFYKEI